MRRIFFAALVWIILVGGLDLYMRRRAAMPRQETPGRVAVAAVGKYSLEVTPGFAPESDPFAPLSEDGRAAALTARFRGRDVLRLESGAAGVPVRVDDLPGVVGGMNEIVLAASPPSGETGRRHFLQARVLRDGVPAAEEIFWADGTARVEGVLRFLASIKSGESGAAGEAGEGAPHGE